MGNFSLKGCCLLLLLLLITYDKVNAGGYHYEKGKNFRSGKVSLVKFLRRIKEHYGVSFVYQKKFISGKIIKDSWSLDQPVDDLLQKILIPLNLNYEKTGKTTYVIFAITQVKEARGNDDMKNLSGNKMEIGTGEKHIEEESRLMVSGKIENEKNEPLPNVSITEVGSSNGTYSNSKGEFIFYSRNTRSHLVISYVGYKVLQYPVVPGQRLSLIMQPDIKEDEEVVVIAYGAKTKKDLTGAVSAINSKDIGKIISLSPQMAMQGRMAGVYVASPGGDPNTEPLVRIRGVTTFSGKNAGPLYVIDGVVIDEYGSRSTFALNAQKADDVKGPQNIFNLINPSDIESISVLKDASSAAAYGARAANGVVLITTKKGKEGRPRVSFATTMGSSNLLKKVEVLNTREYIEVVNEANRGNPDFNEPKYNVFKKGHPGYLGDNKDYDWQSAIINKNSAYRNYDLSISGGTQNATYYLGAGYAYQESSLKLNNQKRYSLSSRTEFKINKILEIGQTLRLAYTDLLDNRNNTGVAVDLSNVFKTPPWQPVYGNGPNGFATVGRNEYGPQTKQNFLGAASVTNKQNDTYKMLGSAYIRLTPVKNLNITANIGGDYFTQRELQWSLRALNEFEKSRTHSNTIGEIRTTNLAIQKSISLHYKILAAGKNFIELYSHAEDQRSSFNALIAGRSGINDVDDPDLFSLNGQGASADGYKDQSAFINYLARLSYKHGDKYYLDATVLRQGSSVFNPKGYQWGTFPSVAAAWRISEEPFIDFLPVNDLKLKFGIGELGNADTKGWQYATIINNINAAYIIGGTPMLGAFFTNYPNPNLTWERLSTYNVALEGAVLKQKLNFSFEYYKRITSRILQPYRLPASAGVIDLPYKNIGAVNNSGVEVTFNFQGHLKALRYSIGANITTTCNRVTRLNDNIPVSTPGGFVLLGDPINSIYGFKSAGVIQTEKELNDYKTKYGNSPLVQQLQLGDVQYVDIGGPPLAEDVKAGARYHATPDGNIDDYDGLAYLGKTIPGFFYGINLSAEYKQVDFSALLQGVGDVKRINHILMNGVSYDLNNKLKNVLNRWSPSNTQSNTPRAIGYGAPFINNARFSDRFIEPASFVRLANIQLGYSIAKQTLQKLKHIEQCRVYISASNAFVITKYSGYDPENDLVPPPRTILLGVNIAF